MGKRINRRMRAKQVRRRKVANIAAISRQFTVSNCTIPKKVDAVDQKGYGQFDIPKEGYPQVKNNGAVHNDKLYQKQLWKNLGKAAKMEAYAQDKLKKWERNNPKPCQNDDLFKDEMIPAWEAEREKALERFRDFVVSMYDKLILIGRFKKSDNSFEEKEEVAALKDINGDGHDVNNLNDKSKLLKKAQEITNKVHAKRSNLVCTRLKDHKRKKGRTILPKAA